MPSGQEYGNRLQNEIRRTLSQYLASLEKELHTLTNTFSSSVTRVRQSLEPIQNLEVPTAVGVIQDLVSEAAEHRRAETSFLADFAYSLRQKETQEDILNSLLDGAHRYAPRTALFVARSEQFIGWSSRGFSEGLARQLSQFSLAHSESPILQGAMTGDRVFSADDPSREDKLSQILRSEAVAPWYAFPLKVLRRPLAVLLVASDSEQSCDVASLSIVMNLTGLCIENLALKILQEISLSATAEARVSAPARSGEPTAESRAKPAESEVVPAQTALAGSLKVETASPGEGSGVEPALVSEVSSATPMAAAAGAIVEAPEAVSQPVRDGARFVSDSITDRAYGPMEAVRELTEEERHHSEAKRFARLLVSEIKLYNEQKLVDGRRSKDIYVRLKRDIDRSRDMYEKRVSPVVARKIDYFHDELIRILGENDPSALGSDYPGPRVEG